MWDYYAHTQGGEVVFKWNRIHVDKNMPPLLRNVVRKGKASQWEPRHRSQTPQSRHWHQMLLGDREKTSTMHGLPPLENGFVGEGHNEPHNSQGSNQCRIIRSTHEGRGIISVERNSHKTELPLLLGNAVRKGKYSIRELWDGAQTPQSQHWHQMLVGDREQTSTKWPKRYLHWQMVWWVKGLIKHPIHNVATTLRLLRTHTGERHY
jgi:hypothetical protein